jgi:lipopolysaccharide transport system ATP-binding protein
MQNMDLHVEDLTKVFKVYLKPSDRLKELCLRRPFHRRVTALHDVTFQAPRGVSLGIVGDNGSGKSTLLRIVARVLKPTIGKVSFPGRVSALLELGAGFHPELSGRDNIYLYGTLLGFSRDYIGKRLKEIIAFSELESAIDQPIKSYSSGMYLRLAFSVATSVNPDLLVIDEALAVGDQYFQKKCVDRVLSFKDAGKTILFCSHSPYLVKQICDRALWLHKGTIRAMGDAQEVLESYQDYLRSREGSGEKGSRPMARGYRLSDRKVAELREVALLDGSGRERREFITGETLRVKVLAQGYIQRPLSFGVLITRNDRLWCYGVASHMDGLTLVPGEGGLCKALFEIPSLPLLSGEYFANVYLFDATGTHILEAQEYIHSFKVKSDSREEGVVKMDHRWETLHTTEDPPKGVRIRPYQPGDEHKIRCLFEAAFEKPFDAEMWRWKNLESPIKGPYIVVAESPQGKLISNYSAIALPCSIRGKDAAISNVVDVMVDKSYRGVLSKEGYMVKCCERFKALYSGAPFSLGYGFPSQRAYKLGIITGIYSGGGRLYWATGKPRPQSYKTRAFYSCRPLEGTEREVFDRIWEGSWLKEQKVSVKRNGDYWSWRYLSHPQYKYHLFCISNRFTGKPLAAMALYFTEEGARLMDAVFHAPPLLPVIWEKALHLTYMMGINSYLKALVKKDGIVAKAFSKEGAQLEPSGIYIAFSDPSGEYAMDDIERDFFFMLGDFDMF